MKKSIYAIIALTFIFSCSNQTENGPVADNWTENQEINFYNNCKDELIKKGESAENAHAFCECCLLKVKEQFSDGHEAMKNLTDLDIETIEKDCMQVDNSQ